MRKHNAEAAHMAKKAKNMKVISNVDCLKLHHVIGRLRRNRMIENKYKIYVNGHLTANNLSLEDVMIYVKAIFETYFNDNSIKVQIMREEIEE